jgi:Flp pilus assembly protein TadG
MVEFAFVLVLFVMMLWAIISYAYAWSLKEQMYHAAQEGLRTALVTPAPQDDDATKQSAAISSAEQRMTGMLNSGQLAYLVITTPNKTGTTYPVCTDKNGVPESGQPRCMTVKLSYDWKHKPGIAPLPGIFDFIPDHITATATGKISS